MSEIKIGKYKHFKGKLYEVIALTKNSEKPLEDFVVYKALYDSEEFGNNAIWIRPKQNFIEKIILDGKEVDRFEFID